MCVCVCVCVCEQSVSTMKFKPTGREIPQPLFHRLTAAPRFLLFNRLVAGPCELTSANVDRELARFNTLSRDLSSAVTRPAISTTRNIPFEESSRNSEIIHAAGFVRARATWHNIYRRFSSWDKSMNDARCRYRTNLS